jgi:hypothetical protein
VSVLPHYGPPLPQHTRHPRSFFRSFGQRAVNGVPHDVTVIRPISHARNDPHVARDLVISDLCNRVRHLVDTCDHPSLFPSQELWRKRARGCVETVASLVLCANVKPELFGDLEGLLCKLGEIEKIRELSAGSEGSFVTRWACLFLVLVSRRTLNHFGIHICARHAIKGLSEIRLEDDGQQTNIEDADEKALANSRRIDDYFETARQICVGLKGAFRPGRTEEQVRAVLARDHEADISKLESAIPVSGEMELIDMCVSEINRINRGIGYALLPGVSFDEFKRTELIQPIQFFSISTGEAQLFVPQILFLNQRLRLLCSYAPKLRDISNGRGDGVYKETLESLRILWNIDDRSRSVVSRPHLMERQLWRLLDLRDAGGFGFLVELFLLVLAQLLSMASSRDTHSALYIETFKAITSSWRQHKYCIGTQRVILNLICDIAIPNRGVISNRRYPEYITNELLVLLGNIVEGQSSSHIDDAMKEFGLYGLIGFGAEVMKVLSRTRAPVPSS